MQQKTLVILKPDALSRGLTGEITARLEKKGLTLVASKMQQLDKAILEEHYAHIASKPFFPDVVSFMTSTPVILQVREGAEAVKVIRHMLGSTNSREALPGTIRGDLANSVGRNLMHASEDDVAAKNEVARFFSNDEIYAYNKSDFNIIYESNEK